MQITPRPYPLPPPARATPPPATAPAASPAANPLVERVVQGELVEEAGDHGEPLLRARLQAAAPPPSTTPATARQALASYQAQADWRPDDRRLDAYA